MRRWGRAFSFLEMVVCVCLIATCLLSIIGILPSSIRSMREADQRESAALFAQTQMEAALATPSNIPSLAPTLPLSGTAGRTDVTGNRTIEKIDMDLYRVRVDVTPVGGRTPFLLVTDVWVP